MLEQSLDSSASHDKQETEEVVQLQEVTITGVPQAAFADHNVQYQFRTENSGGQVTYRVVQVTEDQLEATADGTGAVSVVSTAAFTGAPQAVAQAVIQNPFSNGGSPGGETVGGETRFAYFPAATVSDGTATAVSVQATADPTITQAGVERRRRDKINNWIVTLSKIIPDCSVDSRTGASKGGILSKACDYIRELRQSNQRLQESYKEVERVEMDNELLRQQIEELKNDNALLRAQLQQHGIEVNGDATPQ
ncbi:Upstream stimulatory factor 2 [Collichthys lucidus]|uniref:Upstream stimulatory factor 2 n=1 Tax=Collichthys lucidus TaxID=240159 RepID=A0A4U5VLK0_COLLU|nr:Upstream stimulatory factor 2 [Collichthys lucidus]